MTPKLAHKHLLVRAEIQAPPQHQFDLASELQNLIKHIDMKILAGPFTAWCDQVGNVGWSGVAIIETSSITFHSWSEADYPVIQLDVYSCKPFELATILMWLQQFDPVRIDYKYLDRETQFEILAEDTLTLRSQEAHGPC